MDTSEKYRHCFGQIQEFFIDQGIKTVDIDPHAYFMAINFLCIFKYLAEDAKRNFFEIDTGDLDNPMKAALRFLIGKNLIEEIHEESPIVVLKLSARLQEAIAPTGAFTSVFLTYPLHWYCLEAKDAKERRFGADLLDLFALPRPRGKF